MTREFIVYFVDWRGQPDTFFCRASDEYEARAEAFWALGDLIDILSVQEYTDA